MISLGEDIITVKLTFDLELFPNLTPTQETNRILIQAVDEVLLLLERNSIKVTFFVTGRFAELFPDIIKRVSLAGHEIGNHTMNHQPIRMVTLRQYIDDIESCHNLIKELIGQAPVGFRGPMGNIPMDIARYLCPMGYRYDSSICRTYIPGWYEGGLGPENPYFPNLDDIRIKSNVQKQFIEIPIGTFSFLPIPLGGLFLSSLPLLDKFMFNMCNDEHNHVVFLHPLDLIDGRELKPHIWERLRSARRVRSILMKLVKMNADSDMRLQSIAFSNLANE